jgi:tetratricopeptide (TPR) repeat protein
VSSRHVAGLAVWLVVVAMLVLGAASTATTGRPLRWAVGLIGGLALLSAISSLWSGSVELSVIEADRVLAYLGFFLAAFLIAQTDERRQRFAEGLAIAVAAVALLGLAGRLLPHVLEVGNSLGSGARLRYPLGYWNANGAMAGIAVAMLLWLSRRSAWAALRWAAAAAIPAVLLSLYFTFSRGGLLSLLIAAGCLVVLSRDRLWLLGTLAAGALGAVPAVLYVQAHESISHNYALQATVDQGARTLAFLAAGVALALLLFAALRRLEARGGQRTGRAVALSRNPRLLRGIALGAAILALGAAIAVGGRAWHQFSSSDIQFPNNPEQHFGQLSGAGRHEFWKVAVEGFEEKPLLGTGAGTYRFSWDRHRSISLNTLVAHSLYLEAFSELGIVGGVLVLALVGTLLWIGFSAWRASAPPRRDRYAALLAAMLAFAVGAGLDWFWQIAALGAVFFLAGGVLVSVRCAQLASARRDEEGGFGLVAGGLAIAWIAALALVGPLLVDYEIKQSQSAAAAGSLESAVDHADSARSIEPFAASPYLQLGLLAESQGEYAAARERLTQAIERQDRDWSLYYLRSRVEHEAGEASAAAADLERARELNPREECLSHGWNCG